MLSLTELLQDIYIDSRIVYQIKIHSFFFMHVILPHNTLHYKQQDHCDVEVTGGVWSFHGVERVNRYIGAILQRILHCLLYLYGCVTFGFTYIGLTPLEVIDTPR